MNGELFRAGHGRRGEHPSDLLVQLVGLLRRVDVGAVEPPVVVVRQAGDVDPRNWPRVVLLVWWFSVVTSFSVLWLFFHWPPPFVFVNQSILNVVL
jgi:hypothetical protein